MERRADLRDGGTSAGAAAGQERLGGARADFAANLGRRSAELTAILARIEEQPRSQRLIEDLRRRVH